MSILFASAVEALGWALIHSVWQGAALALVLAVFLRVGRSASVQFRYAVAAAILCVMVAAFGVTLAVCWPKITATATGDSVSPQSTPMLVQSASNTAPARVSPSAPASATSPIPAPVLPANVGRALEPQAASVSLADRFRARLPWAVAFWAAGVIFFSLRFFAGWLSVRRWVSRALPLLDRDWNARIAELAGALKISRPLRLLVSATLTAPAVVGWLKPVVLVPAGVLTGLTAAQIEAILAHELAHIRRHDYLVNLLQNLVETLFFFHPAAWWISRQMRNERENCCDDLAAKMCGGALSYAKALAALEEIRGTAPALAMAASGGSLLDRVRRILGESEQKSAAWPLGILVIGLAAIVLSFSTMAKAQRPDEPAPKDASPLHAEVNDGTYHSYCAYQNGALRFVFLSKHEFTVAKGLDAESATLEFPKGRKAQAHTIKFAPLERGAEILKVSQPSGNLHFHYDLSRARVISIDFDMHGFAPIVWPVPVKLQPITSPELLTKGADEVAKWLAAASSEQKWEYTRERAPEKEYKSGKPLDADAQAIIWGEPNEVGLRLGIGGLAQDELIPAGRPLPIAQYIRNDGKETVKLSPTGYFNEGIRAELMDSAGKSIPMNRGYKSLIGFIRLKLEPGEYARLQSQSLQTILANRDGSPSTAQRGHTSSFVVAPGEYTLTLSHRVGQYEGDPVNANVSDPRCAPGLGEWRGVLQATPIKFRAGDPVVGTGKPGSVAEFEQLHRIQFQKGKLVLSHRASGMTHTGTWAVGADGNWPRSGGTWKIADPGGDYVAAWDEGGTRLWYVDGTGIQRLDIAEKFVDGGYWGLEEATGELANMPNVVRKALNLPAKKEVAPSVTVIRGLSLAGVPGTRDKASLTDLFKADPANPGQFVQKSDVFDMPLYGEKDEPVLRAPKSRSMFYVEQKGLIYGPIAGNPVEELALTDLVRRKLAEKPAREGIALLERMIRKGTQPVKDCAFRLSVDLKEPEGPFDYDGLFSAGIQYQVENDFNMTHEAASGMNQVRTLAFAAHDKWEKRRVVLPDSAYTAGENIAADDPNTLWGAPDKAGVQLGLVGFGKVSEVAIGTSVPAVIVLRNSGTQIVKLSCASYLNGSFRLWFVDEGGKRIDGGFRFADGLGFRRYSHSRLEPGQCVKLASTAIDFLDSAKAIAEAAHGKDGAHHPRIGAPPGKYKLYFDYRVGLADYASIASSAAGSEKVEWTGLLETQPIPLTLAPR